MNGLEKDKLLNEKGVSRFLWQVDFVVEIG